MKIRWRSRQSYLHSIRKFFLRGSLNFALWMKFCRLHAYVVLTMLFLLFLWWNTGTVSECGAQDIVDRVCVEYFNKDAAGNVCKALCETRTMKTGVCNKFEYGIKATTYPIQSPWLMIFDGHLGQASQSFREKGLVTKVSADYQVSWLMEDLPEGVSTEKFIVEVKKYVMRELGISSSNKLLNRLYKDADVNSDDRLNLGEAQNLWRLIHQPFFLVFFLFQDLSVFASMNGSCGGLSMWNYTPYLEKGAGHLFDRHSLGWTLGFLSNTSYRWTLPAWVNRAKVMMGFLELISEFYDRAGGSFHLCNMDGLTMFHSKKFELLLTESSLPLSSSQIAHALRNVSCQSWRDCTLTPQCRAQCDYSSQRCTAKVVKPTLSHACVIVEEYLLYDAPSIVKTTLRRLLQRCKKLTWSTPDLDIQHSLLVLDLRDVIWQHIQHQTR